MHFEALICATPAANRVNLLVDHSRNPFAMCPHGRVDICASRVGQAVRAGTADIVSGIPGLPMGSEIERAIVADDMACAKQDTARSIQSRTRNTTEAGDVRATVAVLRVVPD